MPPSGSTTPMRANCPAEDGEHLVALERKYGARLTFRTDPTYHRETFTLANAQSGEEIKN